MTLLVVDDDPVIVTLLEMNFRMEGYRVLTASDGDEALRLIAEHRPDVVLCDVMMPKLDGHQVLEAVRAGPGTRDLPFLLLSAKAQSSEVQRGLDNGADDYVTKPFDPIDLIDRVDAVLRRARSSHPSG